MKHLKNWSLAGLVCLLGLLFSSVQAQNFHNLYSMNAWHQNEYCTAYPDAQNLEDRAVRDSAGFFYIILSENLSGDVMSDNVLIKIDPVGNVVWSSFLDAKVQYTHLTLNEHQDSLYVIGTEWDTTTRFHVLCLIFDVASGANLANNRYYPSPSIPKYGYHADRIISLPKGGGDLIIAATYELNGGYWPALIRIDRQLNLINDKYYALRDPSHPPIGKFVDLELLDTDRAALCYKNGALEFGYFKVDLNTLGIYSSWGPNNSIKYTYPWGYECFGTLTYNHKNNSLYNYATILLGAVPGPSATVGLGVHSMDTNFAFNWMNAYYEQTPNPVDLFQTARLKYSITGDTLLCSAATLGVMRPRWFGLSATGSVLFHHTDPLLSTLPPFNNHYIQLHTFYDKYTAQYHPTLITQETHLGTTSTLPTHFKVAELFPNFSLFMCPELAGTLASAPEPLPDSYLAIDPISQASEADSTYTFGFVSGTVYDCTLAPIAAYKQGELTQTGEVKSFSKTSIRYLNGQQLIRIKNAAHAEIRVYDVAGKLILERSIENSGDINMSGFNTGIYLVQCKHANGMENQKIFHSTE